MRRAAIDIGTNSVKCLIADMRGGQLFPLLDEIRGTRLGADLDSSGSIGDAAMRRTIGALREVKELCNLYQAEKIICVGAMTLRRAANADDFIHKVKADTGMDVIVLSGELEAELSFLAAAELAESEESRVLVVDAGGGSTELAFGTPKQIQSLGSMPLGAVTLTARHLTSDPPLPQELASLEADVRQSLTAHHPDPQTIPAIGCGGTLTSLAAVFHRLKSYDAAIVHGSKLALGEIKRQRELYMGMSLYERKLIVGLNPQRADIIIAGAAIIIGIMEHFGLAEIMVSDHGLRHGALLLPI
ncbi:MAG: hypothetical protein U1B83_07050 [Candidatus Cloacimonadaceae bacterium]|nr:hypothetical protein [Candidatus Cloacimonadaceae bacterium]